MVSCCCWACRRVWVSRVSVSRSGTRIQPDECFGWVPTWNRIPDRPGTLFTIGSRRLKRGDIVTLTVYHRASISTPRRSKVVQNGVPFKYRVPPRPPLTPPSEEGDAVSRISFSSIVFLVLIGLIGQISQINLIGYGFTLHPPPLKGELEGVSCTYNDNQSPRDSRRR